METNQISDRPPNTAVPLHTGGLSDVEIAATRATNMRELAAIDRENQRRLDELRQRDPEIAQACLAAIEQTQSNRQSRLVAMQKAAKVIDAWETNGAELIAAPRQRLADRQRVQNAALVAGSPNIISQGLRIQRERAVGNAKLHPLKPMQIAGEIAHLGVNCAVRDRELWFDGLIPVELESQIQNQYDAFVSFLENRWQRFARWV